MPKTFPKNAFSYETTLIIVSNNKLKTSCGCMGLIKTRVTEMNLKPSQGLPIMLCYVHEIYNHRGAPWQIKRTPQPRVISVWFQMSHDQGNTHDWTDKQTELSPFNVPQMILLAETQSVNSLPRISVIKMWSGMPLKRWVRNKKKMERKGETKQDQRDQHHCNSHHQAKCTITHHPIVMLTPAQLHTHTQQSGKFSQSWHHATAAT